MPRPDELEPSEPRIKLPEKQWREIEAALGLENPNPALRNRIVHYVELHYAPEETCVPTLRPGELRSWLQRIGEDASRLLEHLTIQNGGDPPKDAQWGRVAVVSSLMRQKERADLCATLANLVESANAAIKSLPHDKGGRLMDWRLYGMIVALAAVYLDETGKAPGVSFTAPGKGKPKRYSGPFFRFVEAVRSGIIPQIDPTFEPPESNHALGKTIQRALAIWRR